jgi:hypothetical protein
MKITKRQLKRIIKEELNETNVLLGQLQEDKEQIKLLAKALRMPGKQVYTVASEISQTNPESAIKLQEWHGKFETLLDELEVIADELL